MNRVQEISPKNILLAVDGSLASKSTTYIASQIAAAMGWSIHAMYVVDVTQVFEIYGDISSELSELGDKAPSKQQTMLLQEQGMLVLAETKGICQKAGIQITTEMVFGGVPDIILKNAKRYSLLALGRRGNRHAKEIQHLGSNFKKIAHRSHIPLLIGGSDNIQSNLRHVLLAYDGSKLSRKALFWTEDLQNIFSNVMTLSVEKEDETDHTWLADRHDEIANSALSQFKFIRGGGNPGQIIAATTRTQQTDLIVMGAYQHTALLEWARHSTIDTVLREANPPVLATK